ncbi:MAG: serine protease [Chloroflexi bacterium]|nr:serine protease [Chloroflexota bacterium]
MACSFGSGSTSTEEPAVPTEEVQVEEPTEEAQVEPTEEAAAPGAVATLQDVRKAVIQIESQGTFIDPEFGLVLNGAGRGSGFIIDPEGIAITNNHVVTGAALLKVWVGGEDEPRNARVLGVSECSDLAVIDIDGDGYEYLDWYQGTVDVGMDVYVAGFPLGDPEYTLTRGVISKAKASGESSWASVDSVIEYDATTNPGNSGGPVIDPNGKVIGIHYAGNSSTRQAYGISKDIALRIIDDLRGGRNVDTIGINGQAVYTEDGTLTGIWVSSVQSGSPADKAGIQAGDIVTMLENLVLATDGTMADYCDILRSHQPTDTLNVEVLRWASGEVLTGQINGRELSTAFVFDPGTETESPSDPGTGSGTTIVNPSPSGSGDFFYYTEFDDDMSDWGWFVALGDDDAFTAKTINSRLRFEINETDTYTYMIYQPWLYDNVRIDTTVENQGRNNNNVSLICRYSEDGWYEFNVANNGEWNILRFDQSKLNRGEWPWVALYTGGTTLIDTSQGAVNIYTAICDGNELTLGINGVEIRTVRDTFFKTGQVGLSVSSFNVTPVIVEFDYFSVTVP